MNIFPVVVALVVSFATTSISGVWAVPFLQKIKFGQAINTVGPTWHKTKQGTPTIGGIMFIGGSLLGVFFGFIIALMRWTPFGVELQVAASRMLSGLLFAFSLGLIGFADDYLKVVKKNNEGLSERQKTILQLIAIITYLLMLWMEGDRSTTVWMPFMGVWDFGLFYYPFSVLIMYATVNAVNFTDGIDGLCISVTGIASMGFLFISMFLSQPMSEIFSAAIVGGCMGFFLWNRNPAKVFMGDTGSLFLGGAIIVMAYGLHRPFLIPLLGIVYVWELMTVVIQRIYYKLTHKRIFKMTPIHHSFELSGYSENKIVILFSAITVVGVIIGIVATYLS